MSARTLPARERQRLDALIDQPLRAFRAGLASLSEGELKNLHDRLEARVVGAHFSRGAHGLTRHLAAHELPLLERRLALVASRATPLPAQLRLLEPAPRLDASDAPLAWPGEIEEEAA